MNNAGSLSGKLSNLCNAICLAWPGNFWRCLCLASWNPKINWPVDCCCKMIFFLTFWLYFLIFLINIHVFWIFFELTLYINIQVGGVHSHLISRVQRDKSRVGCFISQNEIMMTVFPMFQHHIEPHLVHAHVSILKRSKIFSHNFVSFHVKKF